MKLVLASYFEEENHGSGAKIGVSPGRPKDLNYDCDLSFPALSPEQVYWDYMDAKRKARMLEAEGRKPEAEAMMAEAGVSFINGYRAKLDEFVKSVRETAEEEGAECFEVLPFQDGDTLLTWEAKGHQSYRSILAEYLKELGYEVEQN